MKSFRQVMVPLLCTVLAGCGSHMISGVAAVPQPGHVVPGALGQSARYIQAPDGLYIQPCGADVRPPLQRCYALARPAPFGERPIGDTAGFYGPSDIQSMYKLPSATRGKNSLVAIVDAYDDPNLESDLAVYRSNYGLPACTTANGCFQRLNEDGQPGPYPSGNASWGMEMSVDVDMISAVCPNCHIMVIEANTSDITDLGYSIEEAVALGAHVVSTSWGNSEYSGETGADYFFNNPGVMITAGSGDGAYVAGTQYPASNPWVTTVGATSPVPTKYNKRGWAETTWYFPNNNPPNGTSSGCSIYETRKQPWQKDPSCPNRMYTDVSAVGNSVAGYDTYGVSPGWYYFFGTSVASPVIAGVYGLAKNAATLNYGSTSYSQPGGMWDITKGNTGTCSPYLYYCTAGKGYDGPTGNGTPHGLQAF